LHRGITSFGLLTLGDRVVLVVVGSDVALAGDSWVSKGTTLFELLVGKSFEINDSLCKWHRPDFTLFPQDLPFLHVAPQT
jgi:hypothetical protein